MVQFQSIPMLRIAFKYIQATFNNSLHILTERERERASERGQGQEKKRHKVIKLESGGENLDILQCQGRVRCVCVMDRFQQS